MFNDIQIGPLTFHMYGLMIAIGFVSAYLISGKRAKMRGMDERMIDGILVCAVVGGAIGTRMLYYLVSLPEIVKNPSILWDFSHGYVVYGGILGGILATMIYCRIKKENFLAYFDLVMPSVALAQGFGRIGCFCAGCCYGRETTSKFGIIFHHSEFAPNGVRLIPTQLISSGGDFLIAAVLYWYAKKKRTDGCVGALYMILYSIGRFILEFFRADFRGSLGPFSTSQIISIGICMIGMILFINRILAKKKPELA
ncbi:MAG: prolipoprotein diacylglyceryl transferase [Lachnospiraceae bacterium]